MKRFLALGLALLLVGCSGDAKKENNNLGGLPNQNQFRNGEVSLRNALPPTGELTWEVERALVQIEDDVEERQWIEGREAVTYALDVIGRNYEGMVAQAPPNSRAYTREAIQRLRTGIRAVEDAFYKQDQAKGLAKVREMYWLYDLTLLGILSDFDPGVPAEWQNRPLLKGGWAIAEFETSQGKFSMVLDGFNAPLTSGNVLNLIQKGFYDGLNVTRAEKQFVVEFGPGEGKGELASQKVGTIPLELRVARASRQPKVVPLVNREAKNAFFRYKLDPLKLREEIKKIYEKYAAADVTAPLIYNKELPDTTPLALPFTPPATFAMIRNQAKPDSGAGLFYLSFADPELMPPGANVEAGHYSVFGYLVGGIKTVRQLRVGDVIKKASIRTCKEPEFFNEVLSDYTATTLYVDKLTKGTLEMRCLPLPPSKLINTTTGKIAQAR